MSDEEKIDRLSAVLETFMADIGKRLTALEVRAGIKRDPVMLAMEEAAERPRRSFEDMVVEQMVNNHPSTKQFAERAVKAVPDGMMAEIADSKRGSF
jgi:hypothetical protein